MMPGMRIGTWNIAGRWSEHHQSLVADADCDVWLLTEVNERTELPGYALHLSEARMAPRRRWAGVASRQLMASCTDLQAPTTQLPHRIDGLHTIDHLALPIGLDAVASRIDVTLDGKRLSDHDAYVVDLDL